MNFLGRLFHELRFAKTAEKPTVLRSRTVDEVDIITPSMSSRPEEIFPFRNLCPEDDDPYFFFDDEFDEDDEDWDDEDEDLDDEDDEDWDDEEDEDDEDWDS